MASTAVLTAVVAVGAAVGLVAQPEGDIEPLLIPHRGPPGPAQIESIDLTAVKPAAPATGPAKDKPRVSLFGVDASTAISRACDIHQFSVVVAVGDAACEVTARVLQRLPEASADYLSMLVGSAGLAEELPRLGPADDGYKTVNLKGTGQ